MLCYVSSTMSDKPSKLKIADREFTSRLLVGTGKFGWRFQNVDGKTVDVGVQSCR